MRGREILKKEELMLSQSKRNEYIYIINGKTNLVGKLYLLEKVLDEADNLLKEKRHEITVRKLHFLQLDIISKLCTIVEDFLYFHRVFRKNIKNIHREILDNIAWWANNEAKYFKTSLNQKEIRRIYNLPDISKFELSKDDLNILRKAIKKNLIFHQNNLKEIGNFWKEHKEIYNIFKHGYSIITGMYSQDDLYKPSHFYARAFEKTRSKKRKRIKTYMITCEDKIFKSYDYFRQQIHAEFNSLLKNKEMALLNPNKLFIPDLYDISNENELKEIKKILKIINKGLLIPSTLKRYVEIKGSALKKIKRKSNFYIMRIRRDIMFSSKAEFKAEISKIDKK